MQENYQKRSSGMYLLMWKNAICFRCHWDMARLVRERWTGESQYGETHGARLSSQVDPLFLARLLDALLAGVERTLLALGGIEESLLCRSICNRLGLE
jgi:hypothetical protein